MSCRPRARLEAVCCEEMKVNQIILVPGRKIWWLKVEGSGVQSRYHGLSAAVTTNLAGGSATFGLYLDVAMDVQNKSAGTYEGQTHCLQNVGKGCWFVVFLLKMHFS